MTASAPVLAVAGTSWFTLPGAIFAGISVILIVSAVLVFFRAAYAKATIDALRGDRDDLMKRTEILEHDNTELRAQLEGTHQKIEVLEQLATGKSAVGEVLIKLTEHDSKVAEITTMIRRIDRAVSTMTKGS